MDRLCPNYTAGPRQVTRGVFIHATRSGLDRSLQEEYDGTVAYFLRRGADSSHVVVGPAQAARCVRDEDCAWHAQENNATHLSIEVAQPKADVPFTEWQYQTVAGLVREWATGYGFPLRRVMSQLEPGIIGHEDSEQGKRWGKSDPGPRWDWQRFLGLLQD